MERCGSRWFYRARGFSRQNEEGGRPGKTAALGTNGAEQEAEGLVDSSKRMDDEVFRVEAVKGL